MSTLLLRLAGPMQSWGTDSKFDVRRTGREPSKSGVIGLVAAALGIRRQDREGLNKLLSLRFGVRVDREGSMMRDFQTAEGESKYVTYRYYLADAVFVAGLESEDTELLQQIGRAIEAPAFPLYLGRRSCPPEGRVCLGLRQMPLEETLKSEPSLIPPKPSKPGEPQRVRIVLDDPRGTARLNDLPVSFSPYNRQYAYRAAREMWNTFPANDAHDPMLELGGD